VGLAADAAELPEEWVEAVRSAKVPEEFAHLDSELKSPSQKFMLDYRSFGA
jgi:hypothetical protein